MDMDKKHFVELLNSRHPVYNVDGNIYSYRFSEIARYSFDNFDHKLVKIEFTLPSCFDQVIEVKSVANKLTQKLRETAGKDLFLISSERIVINRIVIYVDFQDILKDTKRKKRDMRVEQECRYNDKTGTTTPPTAEVPNILRDAIEAREALKSKLSDTLIFNKVRDFLGYYARNKDRHDRDLNGSSYLSQKMELSNCGLQVPTEELTTLYVEFCKEAGFTDEEIEDDLDYRGKSIIANRIIEYNQAITNGSHEERFAYAKNWLMEYVSAKAEKLKPDIIL